MIQLSPGIISGQKIIAEPALKGKVGLTENLVVISDRDIYISGETLLYSVIQVRTIQSLLGTKTSVGYVELLNHLNEPVVRQIVKLELKPASHAISIPDTVKSGKYQLRVYSSYMKNQNPESFGYQDIIIINPLKAIDESSFVKGSDLKTDGYETDNQAPYYDSIDYGTEPVSGGNIGISLKSDIIGERSLVGGEISLGLHSVSQSGGVVSVTVVKSGLINENRDKSDKGVHKSDNNSGEGSVSEIVNSDIYLPEPEGHLVSGVLYNRASFTPIKDVRVMLSIRGKIAKSYFATTDNTGRFFFVINEYGIKEVVIMPVNINITDYYVELNDPFVEKFCSPGDGRIYLDSTRITAINNAVIASQVARIYGYKDKWFRIKSQAPGSFSFYGKPDRVVKPAEFIELGNIKEVVKEIIPTLSVTKKEGEQTFRLVNRIKGFPIHTDPLILIDGIPSRYVDELLKLHPSVINRIELVDVSYYTGRQTIDGIVSFFSETGDLTSDESRGMIFRRLYTFYEPEAEYVTPVYDNEESLKGHEPDFRNTLYWNPAVDIDQEGKGRISFYTGDEPGEYIILVRFVDEKGRVEKGSLSFVIGSK